MRLLIQRVIEASVSVNGNIISQIGPGMLVLVGFEDSDTNDDLDWGSRKLANLRIFDDENAIPNLSLLDTGGDLLLVSQFTLFAATKKGNRPSYIRAGKGDIALECYKSFIDKLETLLNKKIKTGEFGVPMKVNLVNEGPLTIWIDSKNKE